LLVCYLRTLFTRVGWKSHEVACSKLRNDTWFLRFALKVEKSRRRKGRGHVGCGALSFSAPPRVGRKEQSSSSAPALHPQTCIASTYFLRRTYGIELLVCYCNLDVVYMYLSIALFSQESSHHESPSNLPGITPKLSQAHAQVSPESFLFADG
jgi:hypothetical protein